MNGPLISDIIAAADIPSFPWTRSLIIIGVIVLIGTFITAVVSVNSDDDRGYRFVFGFIVTLAFAGGSLLVNAVDHKTIDRTVIPIADELSETYGVTILAGTASDFRKFPRVPSRAADFTVLVDGTPRPCTIVTDAVRYSISCEQGKDIIVLTPKENS